MELNNIIQECRDIKNRHNLTNDDVYELVQKNHNFVSKRTIQRFFSNDREYGFRYNSTVKPIYNSLKKLDDTNKSIPITELVKEKDKEIEFLKLENKYLKELIDSLINNHLKH